ncbi:carbonic anhydrase 2 [Drosophila serrata]|uniref:carbonic anhydrase 2 n=1 Tax=Drosophila serrata TaxID=7274 RepID=UPI000A1D3524|nr:carbonic anhydrase 2 [Drosophila serrata]
MLFSIIQIFWHTFMNYFGMMMELADKSRFVTLLISCTMSMAFILNIQCGRAVFHSFRYWVTNKSINSKLNRYASPVDIVTRFACQLQSKHSLVWTHYYDLPLAMLLENNGSTVILRGCYPPNSVPHLSGGDLRGRYHFVEANFKWGAMRSEHSIDGQQFSLELQVLHYCPQQTEYLAISYLFLRTRFKNVPLKQVTENLRCIRWAGSSIELPPFELGTLLRTFGRNYYSYQGTYDNGEMMLPVTWLIDPQLSHVRFQQVIEFTALCGKDGSRIMSSGRVEKSLGNRSLLFYS